MHDDIRARSRRAIVLFIGSVTLAFAMFTTGLLIGRWVRVPESAATIHEEKSPSGSRSEEVAASASPDEPASYLIQAGRFSSASEAERFAAHLKERGFDQAFTRPRSTPDGESVVEVVLGPFEDTEAAARTLRELRNYGVSDVRLIPNR
ncbi:MAG: SPOR domain-containing protein [Blastocatellia bacterium]|nr:SPOR domain-containing protein [Blastocatellia bacterium]MCS7157847.1 SPOR domain-containing protein [Blastocatellia bacterium]MDW8168075.1 SPOR domain-containing protein [Acidobacteriota bacterium]MDW8257676.1 SPOR domain-containing protein [Acidobacteriota bacterium]